MGFRRKRKFPPQSAVLHARQLTSAIVRTKPIPLLASSLKGEESPKAASASFDGKVNS